MNGTGLRRRDVLATISAGCVTVAGSTADELTETPAEETPAALYGLAYGRGYGTE
ncbi:MULTISPECIES: hypothetical protein [Natronorubrum]|uniref:Uncharacterized protein n=1 Tax=Natronorubrum thiooxidans TaxID=308853 RepID=A0A1N7BZN0_9EURY|nr:MULTISPECIES: hypothetical protein [Natronorubrum]SIR56760.1 hypothetical protein SAMN05421752_10122 [Natronorubrum thiooxidans]